TRLWRLPARDRRLLVCLVPQVRAEPPLRLLHARAPAGRVVLDLVPAHPADGEVARLRMGEIDAADRGNRGHRERLRQLEPDELGVEELEELALLRMVRTGRIPEGRPDAADALR